MQPKMYNMKKRTHFILMIITLAVTVACGMMIPYVNANSDMTKYLPDDSQMKQGIEIITNEFGEEHLSNANVKVMFQGLDSLLRQLIAEQLALRDEVNGVTTQVSEDGQYTKYDLLVLPSIDQKAFGNTIQNEYGKRVVVETSQDGATPPISALVIAGIIMLIILLVMAQSWMEPVLYLFTIGVAVVLNIGTNALLPSVSITTNYIVAILQLVLSLDYAIVLSNHYRQEWSNTQSATEAVNRAIRKAFPAIMSSATTTIVGLMMLAFMRVKIGLDLGVVLAKGVLLSLVTTFTLLPALLLLCNKAIVKSHKRTFILPTDRLAWFSTHHKRPFAVACIVLCGVAFYFSRQTDIYFSTNGESEIDKIFPKTNMIVTVYPTAEQMRLIPMVDSLMKDSCVKTVVSYPTMLKQQYTAKEQINYIHKMSVEMAEYLPPIDVALLTPEMMRTVYYMRSHEADTLRVSFPDLMQFVLTDCLNNPMFDNVINNDVREQMTLLQTMMETDEEEEEPVKHEEKKVTPPEPKVETVVVKTIAVVDTPKVIKPDTVEIVDENISVAEFMPRLYALNPGEITEYLMQICNPASINENMTIRQMANHIGSTVAQTRMVYSFSDQGKSMTPYQYVHFLTDDLFNRPTLAKFVNEEQKQGLILRTRLMDAVKNNSSLNADELTDILTQLGVNNLSKERVLTISGKAKSTVVHQPTLVEAQVQQDTTTKEVIAVAKPITKPVTKPTPVVKKRKSRTELQAERFEQLMYSGKRYTAAQMTNHFKYMGQQIDRTTVNLLYCYYGSRYHYNDSLRMSTEQLLAYAADTLLKLDIVASQLDSHTIQMIDSVQSQLSQAIQMLSHDKYSLMMVMCDLPDESAETYAFIDHLTALTQSTFSEPCYMIGESVMFSELKNGFSREMTVITILTILAIFLIVAITFRSVVVPTILVIVVMTAVFVNVVVSGLVSGQMLYLAYLIVQSILMGATIDYGILYANYYKENRHTMDKYEAAREAYHGSIPTITTSGLIMVVGPGVMALLVEDVTISAIVGCISVGAAVAISLILVVLPGVLVVMDKWVTAKSIRDRETQRLN